MMGVNSSTGRECEFLHGDEDAFLLSESHRPIRPIIKNRPTKDSGVGVHHSGEQRRTRHESFSTTTNKKGPEKIQMAIR